MKSQTVLLQFLLAHISAGSPQIPVQISVALIFARSFLTPRTVFSKSPALGLTSHLDRLMAPDFSGFLHFRYCCHHNRPVIDHQALFTGKTPIPTTDGPHPHNPFVDSHFNFRS